MCRSIKTLRTTEGAAPLPEIEAAALQFVRKVSGMRDPSPVNAEVFTRAVAEVAAVSERLLSELPPKKRVTPRADR